MYLCARNNIPLLVLPLILAGSVHEIPTPEMLTSAAFITLLKSIHTFANPGWAPTHLQC